MTAAGCYFSLSSGTLGVISYAETIADYSSANFASTSLAHWGSINCDATGAAVKPLVGP